MRGFSYTSPISVGSLRLRASAFWAGPLGVALPFPVLAILPVPATFRSDFFGFSGSPIFG
jgi:hypothetical protein